MNPYNTYGGQDPSQGGVHAPATGERDTSSMYLTTKHTQKKTGAKYLTSYKINGGVIQVKGKGAKGQRASILGQVVRDTRAIYLTSYTTYGGVIQVKGKGAKGHRYWARG